MPSFILTAASLLAAASAALALKIESPPSIIQGQPVQIAWSEGAAGDIFLSVIPGGDPSAAALVSFPTQNGASGTFTWTPELDPGTSITLKAVDSTGVNAYSSPVTIQAGAGGAAPAPGGSSSAASSVATSASSAASSAASGATSTVSSAASSASSAATNRVSSAVSGASSVASSLESAITSAGGAATSAIANAGNNGAGYVNQVAFSAVLGVAGLAVLLA